jgi:FKBP-type peptidyl-prolyl cis-trans isomerase
MMESSNEKSKFFSALKTEKKNSKASANNLRINVILSGEGRRFTHNSEFSGTFAGGLMEGKGYCSIKEGEDIYEYTGEFKDGLKCGKGLEKFKLTSYDGDF